MVSFVLQPPQNTIRFTSRGTNTAAEQFFYVDSITGEISVKQALTLDNNQNSFYEVRRFAWVIIGWILPEIFDISLPIFLSEIHLKRTVSLALSVCLYARLSFSLCDYSLTSAKQKIIKKKKTSDCLCQHKHSSSSSRKDNMNNNNSSSNNNKNNNSSSNNNKNKNKNTTTTSSSTTTTITTTILTKTRRTQQQEYALHPKYV